MSVAGAQRFEDPSTRIRRRHAGHEVACFPHRHLFTGSGRRHRSAESLLGAGVREALDIAPVGAGRMTSAARTGACQSLAGKAFVFFDASGRLNAYDHA